MRRRRLRAAAILLIFAAVLAVTLFKVLPEIVKSRIYREEYTAEIERYSALFNVDPSLVYSVIKVESNFDPSAKSDAGAIGLMQIIEESFDWVAWRLGREDLRFEDMYTPEYSIMFGCYMLGFLMDRYNSVELAAAAYHSGMGTVDSWIESGRVDPDNVDIESIEGSSTRHYVGKIMRAYKNYSNR